MDTLTLAHELVLGLARHMEIPEFHLDASHSARVEIDGMLFIFSFSEESEEIYIIAYIAPLPQQKRHEVVTALLQGNYAWGETGGGVLGFDENIDYVTLSRRLYVPFLSASLFLEEVARQFMTSKHWHARIEADSQSFAVAEDTALKI